MSDWFFIYGAYAVAGIGLGGYAVTLIRRVARVSRRLDGDDMATWVTDPTATR